MKLKWIVPVVAVALIGFVAVPAMACGGQRTQNGETITASTDTVAPEAATEAAPVADETEHDAADCDCSACDHAAADSDTTETELTNTAPATDSVCPHAAEQAAADDDNS